MHPEDTHAPWNNFTVDELDKEIDIVLKSDVGNLVIADDHSSRLSNSNHNVDDLLDSNKSTSNGEMNDSEYIENAKDLESYTDNEIDNDIMEGDVDNEYLDIDTESIAIDEQIN